MKFKALAASLAIALFMNLAKAESYEDGVAAHRRGDYQTALRLFKTEAEQGNLGAVFALGLMYSQGQGVPQDYVEALWYFKVAAEYGVAAAQYNLGVMYREGQGVPQDYDEAVRWYKLAAQQGDADAQFNLGLMYAKSLISPQDWIRAHLWFNLATANGDTNSAEFREIAARQMTPQQIAEAQTMARECLASNYKKCD